MSRQSLAISIGDVLIFFKFLLISFLGNNSKAGSCVLGTEDFDAKKKLDISSFCCGSVMTWSFSIIGGIEDILFLSVIYFVSLSRVLEIVNSKFAPYPSKSECTRSDHVFPPYPTSALVSTGEHCMMIESCLVASFVI